MDDTPVRKLAVLLHADVVSSTELVRKNETLAHQRIQDAFQRLSETVSRFNGLAQEIRGMRLLQSSKWLLMQLRLQSITRQLNTAHNQKLTDEILPLIRIGIAMGEVVIADNTITGEGCGARPTVRTISRARGYLSSGSRLRNNPQAASACLRRPR